MSLVSTLLNIQQHHDVWYCRNLRIQSQYASSFVCLAADRPEALSQRKIESMTAVFVKCRRPFRSKLHKCLGSHVDPSHGDCGSRLRFTEKSRHFVTRESKLQAISAKRIAGSKALWTLKDWILSQWICGLKILGMRTRRSSGFSWSYPVRTVY